MKLLIIDDNPGDRTLIVTKVLDAFPECEIVEAGTRDALERALVDFDFDAVVTDYFLGWSDGLVVLRRVKERFPYVPVLMVTGSGNEQVATEGMREGLSDYIIKGHWNRLPVALLESLKAAALRRERDEAVARLGASEERYRMISECMLDFVYSFHVDEEGMFALEFETETVRKLTGYSLAGLMEERGGLDSVIHPDDLQAAAAHRDIAFSGKPDTCEFRIVTRDGRELWLRDTAVPVFDETGARVVRVIGATQDITERKLAEEALKNAEQEKEAILQSLSENVLFQDTHFRILWANKSAAETAGRPPGKMAGWLCYEVYHNRIMPCEHCPVEKAVVSGQFREGEVACGEGKRWKVRGYPVRDGHGNVAGVVAIEHDVTVRRKLDDQLVHAQKMDSIGNIAQGIAHDFNNILSGILGNTAVLKIELTQKHALYEYVESTEKGAIRGGELVAQLISFAKGGKSEKRQVSVNAAVKEMLGIIGRTFDKSIAIDTTLPGDVPVIEADPGQVQQVVMNLCINARDAMPMGGKLAIETGRARLGPADTDIHVDAAPGEYVTVRIRDNGIGMDPAVVPRIFDPFFTTKEKGRGSGLGLSVVYGIVKAHRGFILVESAIGKGSTFTVYLPLSAD